MIKRKDELSNLEDVVEGEVTPISEEETREIPSEEEEDLIPNIKAENITDVLKQTIEQSSKSYHNLQVLNRWIAIVLGSLAIVFVCLAAFLWLRTIGTGWTIGIIVLVMGVVVAHNFIGKAIIKRKGAEFLEVYYKVLLNYFLDDDRYQAVINNAKGKLPLETIQDTRTYVNLASSTSRNITNFTLNEHRYCLSEAAFFVQDKNKKMTPTFVGKLIAVDNTLEFPGRILISIKGKSDYFCPLTDTAGLSVVMDTNRMVIYSSYDKYRHIITKEVLDALSQLKVDNNFISYFISIKSGVTYIGMDLGNELMDLPTDKPFNDELNAVLKARLNKAIDICEMISFKRF